METNEGIISNLKTENKRLLQQVKATQNRFENKAAELSLIRELGMGLQHDRSLENACEFILNTIINNTIAQNCSVMLLDHDSDRLFLVSATDFEGNTFSVPAENVFAKKDLRYTFASGQGAAGQAVAGRKPVLVRDTSKSSVFNCEHDSRVTIKSLLAVPLQVATDVLGVVNLSHTEANAFGANDVNLFHIIADYLAISLQNILTFEKLESEVYERQKIEKASRATQEELGKRIQERTSELVETNEKLKKEISERKAAQLDEIESKKRAEMANHAKSDFLANMSHEIRTPLNHIIGFTELVLDNSFGEINETQAEYLTDIRNSGQHLLSLINDILDISKIEAGKLKFEPSECEIKYILENSLTMVKEKAMKHGVKLSLDVDSVPNTITADDRKVKQILYNLLSNAVKFTPAGGTVHLAAKETGSNGSNQNALEIRVEDTGVGIDAEHLQRIFDPFEQATGSESVPFEGTGLGLSITKRLVELHGGKIWAESAGKDKGSVFHVIIPS